MPNLPAVVAEKGGAIVEVLEWEQHLGLTPKIQFALGLVIQEFPMLNEPASVDYLADMASHFGESINPVLVDLIGRYGLEMVYFAIDALSELGERGQDDGDRERHTDVERLLNLLQACADGGYPISTLVVLEEIGRQFNGVEHMLNAPVDVVLVRRAHYDGDVVELGEEAEQHRGQDDEVDDD